MSQPPLHRNGCTKVPAFIILWTTQNVVISCYYFCHLFGFRYFLLFRVEFKWEANFDFSEYKKYSAHTKSLLICWCWTFCHLLLQNFCSKQLFKIEITIFVTMQKLSPKKKTLNMFLHGLRKCIFQRGLPFTEKLFPVPRAFTMNKKSSSHYTKNIHYIGMCAALLLCIEFRKSALFYIVGVYVLQLNFM